VCIIGGKTLFGNQKGKTNVTTTARRTPATKDTAVTILTSGCHFTGKLYCRGSSRIGGKIEGEIISEGLLIIEEGASIAANITADEAVIQGTVKGKLRAKTRVELAPTCKFEGDILTPSLIVYEGAQFNGRSQMVSTKGEVTGGKVIEPAFGSTNNKVPELRADPDMGDEREPDVAMMKLDELSTQPV
jgi:cytoskeletal protein CcmA (bactofilin family)